VTVVVPGAHRTTPRSSTFVVGRLAMPVAAGPRQHVRRSLVERARHSEVVGVLR
jgi:hypothetical protein